MRLSLRAVERVLAIRSANGLSGDSALRIARSEPDSDDLTIGFVEEPPFGDEVAEAYGLRYCIESAITPVLDDVTLDLAEDADGTVFVLRSSDPTSNGQAGE
ncbi:MAG: hypothetical protein AB7O92_29120 [Acidimicrobiia bacterium]